MNTEQKLLARSESKCEMCGATETLSTFEVPPDSDGSAEKSVLLCETCRTQIKDSRKIDAHHWRCLNESMWSQVPAVQVLAWRMLHQLSAESWSRELLEMLYLEEETLAWAQATGVSSSDEGEQTIHFDSNGAPLATGDTVTLTKDLNVKGANFTAKRGTAVRGISVVPNTPEQIEGRVNGQHIVILTKFVKKSN